MSDQQERRNTCPHAFKLRGGTAIDCDHERSDHEPYPHEAAADGFNVAWESGTWFDHDRSTDQGDDDE